MPLVQKHDKHVPTFITKGNDMAASIEQQPARRNIWRIISWVGAVVLILTPLVAMQFTREVVWTGSDFIFAAVIFGTFGGLIELTVRISSNWYYRFGALFAVLVGFVIIWANAAVGMIGDEDNPVNLWFGAVLLIAICGAILARFRSRAMAIAMFTAGLVQATIGIATGIFGTDTRGGILTLILAGLWMISATLFRSAAVDDAAA